MYSKWLLAIEMKHPNFVAHEIQSLLKYIFNELIKITSAFSCLTHRFDLNTLNIFYDNSKLATDNYPDELLTATFCQCQQPHPSLIIAVITINIINVVCSNISQVTVVSREINCNFSKLITLHISGGITFLIRR